MTSWSAVPQAIREKFPPPPSRASFASSDEFEEALGYWQGHVGRNLGLAMQKYRETPRCLVYRLVPHNRGLVFSEPERADHIAAIHLAIRTSKSWGEFRERMPPDELEQLMASTFDHQGETRPLDTDFFDGEALPGWSEGDYPPWLQQEQGNVLPQDILHKFAQSVPTALNGSYWHIAEEKCDDVCSALRTLGFSVQCRQDQPFH